MYDNAPHAELILPCPEPEGLHAFMRDFQATVFGDDLTVLVHDNQIWYCRDIVCVHELFSERTGKRDSKPFHVRVFHVAFHGLFIIVATDKDHLKIILCASVAELH